MSDLKLLGKLGLDLNRLKTDVNSMQTIIDEANKHSKTLGQTWQQMGRDMEKAFKNVNISDIAKALEKIEKANKNGLNKMLSDREKFHSDNKRKEEAHKANLLLLQQQSDSKIVTAQLKANQSMELQKQRFQNAELRAMEKHHVNLLNAMQSHQSKMNKFGQYNTQNSFSGAFGKVADYAIAVGAIHGVKTAFKEAVKVNREFEQGQINLQRILGATDMEMAKIKQTTIEVAKETGNAFKAVQDIENLWIRTNDSLNADNLKELTKITAIGLNVAEFKSAEESVSYLVAAVNQMADGDFSKVGEILDSWAKTADYTAVKATSDLAEVASRCGSQAQQLGLSFHDLNGIVGIVSEKMNISGEKMGTALKSVFARFQDPTYYSVLEKWGIQVTKIGESGKLGFRNFADVMDDLNAKFKELKADEYTAAIAEIQKAFGGTYFGAMIGNIIEHWDRFGEIVKTSMDSAGFAMEQNEKIMQSFDKQVEVLKATLGELALSVGENGLMGTLLGLVQGVQSAVDWFNNLNPHVRNSVIVATELITVFGLVNTSLKKITQVNLVHLLSDIIKKRTGIIQLAQAHEFLNAKIAAGAIEKESMSRILSVLSGKEKMAILTANERTVALQAQTSATYTATAATYGLMAVIGLATVAVTVIIGAITSYNRSKEELTRKTLEHIKNEKDEIAETERLSKEYETLKGKVSLTADEQDRLKEIEEKLIELYPDIVKGIDNQKSSYTNLTEAIKNATRAKKEQMLTEAILFRDANITEYNKSQEKIKKYQNQYDNANEDLKKQNYLLDVFSLNRTEYPVSANHSKFTPTDEQVAERQLKLMEKIKQQQEFSDKYEANIKFINDLQNDINNPQTTSGSAETSGDGNNSGNNSGIKFDPNEFDDKYADLKHALNMGRISLREYANLVENLHNENEPYLDKQKSRSMVEEVYNIRKPKLTPKDKEFGELQFKHGTGEISNSELAKGIENWLLVYADEIEQTEYWSAKKQIYNLLNNNTSKNNSKDKKNDNLLNSSEEVKDLRHNYNLRQIDEKQFAAGLKAFYKKNEKKLTLDEKRNLLETIYQLENTDPKIPQGFQDLVNYLNYEQGMERITAKEHADGLRAGLAEYKGQLSEKVVQDTELKIHNLDKYETPKEFLKLLSDLEYSNSMDEITVDEYIEGLENALEEYYSQLDTNDIRNTNQKIYNAKKNNKPEINKVNFDDYTKSLKEIQNEITKLDKQEQYLGIKGDGNVTLLPVVLSKINEYKKSINELIYINEDYLGLIYDIDRQINDLDPSSMHYTETLKELTEQKRLLTEEMIKNANAILDYEITIARAEAQIQGYIEDSIKKAYTIYRDEASKELDKKHKKELYELQKSIFQVTEEDLKAHGLINLSIEQQEEAYSKIIEKKKSAKQKELDMLQEQINMQEHLNQLTDIQDEMRKVKDDTRFAYIDEATGKEIYTYDKEKLKKLEKDLEKKNTDNQNKEIREKLQSEIKYYDEQSNQIREFYNENHNILQEMHKKEKEEFDTYWEQRLSDENIKQESLLLIQKEGYENALLYSQRYYDEVKAQYDTSQIEAYNGGKQITDSLSDGLFSSIDSVISRYKAKISELTSLSDKVNELNNEISASDIIKMSGQGRMLDTLTNLPKHHNGGFVGGSAINGQHERVAKLLDGELVLSLKQLNRLSLALPQLNFSNIDIKKPETVSSNARPIIIQIDKLTPSDFDGFMKSIEPYINSHR